MNLSSQIDFSSLYAPISQKEVNFYAGSSRTSGTVHAASVSLFILISVLIGLGLQSVVVSVFFIVIFLIVYVIVIKSENEYLREVARRKRFVYLNQFLESIEGVPGSKPGMIFGKGRSQKVTGGYRIDDNIELANYTYVTGYGRSSTTHYYTYVQIPLKRHMPHMVLDSTSNNFLKTFSNLPMTISQSQVLSLEGNFDKYFTLYAPKKYERDALYVFTPDVMEKLISECRNYDVEIVDDFIYLYKKNYVDLMKETEIRSLLGVIDVINSELQRQTYRYRDDRVAQAEQGVETIAVNEVSAQGRRLKGNYRVSLYSILIIVLGVIFGLMMPR
jgi:hypothetical protein